MNISNTIYMEIVMILFMLWSLEFISFFFFFFNDTATTEIYTLSLHDALPICNARKCSMLLTNVTRSASYEALPNHRLFPAKSGLTSRFPLRNRGLWHRRSNKSGDAVGRPSR